MSIARTVRDSAGHLYQQVRAHGGLDSRIGTNAYAGDCATEWRELVSVIGPGLLRRQTGLAPDIMASVLGFDSDDAFREALLREAHSRRVARTFLPNPELSTITPDEEHTLALVWAMREAS